jgi:hypothetical protein
MRNGETVKWRQVIATVMICCLSMGSGLLSAFGAEKVEASTFADLSGHWAKADIEYLGSKGVIDGVAPLFKERYYYLEE